MVEQKEQEPTMNEQVTWSWTGMVRGMRSIIPLALGGLTDGIVWGCWHTRLVLAWEKCC